MEFKLSASDGEARCGVIETQHARIETPVFMPCGTIGAVKAVRWSELEELGYQLVLMNALHLFLRPGHDCIKELGGVHSFTRWNRAVLTDSGGYQFFSLKGLFRIDDDGVTFQSPYDGSKHHFNPEKVIEIQTALGSDIIMPLDHCPHGNASRREIIESGERTIAWLKRAYEKFNAIGNDSQALFGIVQGGTELDLRIEYLERLQEYNLSGYALGGISVGEERAKGDEVVSRIAPRLPSNKPRYLMGVGLPDQILHGVECGIDMFDCVLPTRMARNGTLFTSRGRVNITNSRYRRDQLPLDEKCACPTCARYSKAYLAHLFRAGDPGVLGHLTIHNLSYYRELLIGAKTAIIERRFANWKNEIESGWQELNTE